MASSCLVIFAIFLVLVGHLVSGAKPAEAFEFEVKNICDSAILTFINGDSTAIPLQPRESISIAKPVGSSITIWGCKSGDTNCNNSVNPIATVGLLHNCNDSNSYSVSAEGGYNLGIKIMPIAGITNCPTISCDAKLEDFPNQLKIINSKDVVIVIKPPNCVESEELCSSFSSLITANDSRCRTPGSSYGPSSITSSCPSTTYLVVIFSC